MTANEIFEQLLKARKIEDLESFKNPDYSLLADPYLLPGMDKAVSRIEAAIAVGETVAIYGDYDIDGLTATAVLAEAFEKYGLKIETYIPDRFIDGYGLSQNGIDDLKERGANLIITVDTGSLAVDQVEYARKNSIDVIVTDHHNVGKELPNAVAVLNPKREDSNYPYSEMAGVGVAFTLVRAIQQQREEIPEGQEKWLLDYVALGTVCDVVPLTDENRTLVYWGLEVLRQSRRPSMQALAHVSSTELSDIDTTALGFRFGPRLNASGRLEHADMSLQLLREKTGTKALELAQDLDNLNHQRRSEQNEIFAKAHKMAASSSDRVLVLADKDWNHGIIGIVASKLVEEFKKPVFVLQIKDEISQGSARSFGDFHLSEAIESNRGLLIKGGGHYYAAGITIDTEKIDDFRKAVNNFYKNLKLGDQEKYLLPDSDLELKDFSGLDEELIEKMKQLAPFGTLHPQPIFKISNVNIVDWRPVGADGRHAKITFEDKNGVKRDGIGFGLVDKMPEIGSTASTTIALEINEFNGRRSLQHRLIDIQ